MSTAVNNEEDHELEEGEIADDSNDGGSISDDFADNANDFASDNAKLADGQGGYGGQPMNQGANFEGNNQSNPNDPTTDGAPQKKRKKVVRKVRRKIKVKKKVLKKKGQANDTETNDQPNQGQNQPLLPHHQPTPMLPHLQQQQQQQQQQQPPPPPQQTGLLNQHLQQQSMIGQPVAGATRLLPLANSNNDNNTSNNNNNQSAQPDSLWEQQILMLQEMQHAQILRAAATDEDLRIFPHLHLQQQSSTNTTTPMGQLVAQQPLPLITNTTAINTMSNIQNVTLAASTTPPPPPSHQTPSSPDDENGKSSYEAISKMLTMLRNSANISESSEMMNDHDRDERDRDSLEKSATNDSVEYSLIPILVDGIDYTKYKLLSQYEPKFKNDPRLK